MRADYAVLIVNYRCAEHTIRAVKSVLANARADLCMVQLVDNSSGESDRRALAEISDPRVAVTCLPTNGGFAKGYNAAARIAVERATPRYLVIMNPDIEIGRPGSIEDVIRRIEASERSVSGAQPRIWNYRLQGEAASQRHLRRVPDYWDLVVCESVLLRHVFRRRYDRYTMAEHAPYDSVVRFEVPSGAFFVIRTEDFMGVGGFDEMTFLYGEELIFGHKLRARSLGFLLEPAVEVRHFQGASTRAERFVPSRVMFKHRVHSHVYYVGHYLGAGTLKRWGLRVAMECGEALRVAGAMANHAIARVRALKGRSLASVGEGGNRR